MSARNDYPWPVGDPQQAIKQHGVMCDEIDRLRADAAVYENDVMPRLLDKNRLVAALDEQIRELTKHADAMRALLSDVIETGTLRHDVDFAHEIVDRIEAYDEFIKEA